MPSTVRDRCNRQILGDYLRVIRQPSALTSELPTILPGGR